MAVGNTGAFSCLQKNSLVIPYNILYYIRVPFLNFSDPPPFFPTQLSIFSSPQNPVCADQIFLHVWPPTGV